MNIKHATLFLAVVLIISAFFRLYQLKNIPPGLYPDEAVNAYNAVMADKTGNYRVYYPENNGREGLFINIQAAVLKIFDAREPWTLRLPSALMGILTVWGIYILGRELFDKRVALFSAFLGATSLWHVIFSRIGFRAIMAPMFLVFSLALLLIALRKAKGGASSWTVVFYSIIGGLAFGLGFHSYIAYRIAPIILLAIFFFKRRDPLFYKSALLFIAAAIIAALPIGIYYYENPADFLGRTSQVSIFSDANPALSFLRNTAETVGMLFIYGDANWRHNYSGHPALFLPTALFFVYAAIISLKHLFRNGGKRRILWFMDDSHDCFATAILFLWIITMILPVAVSNEGLPHALRSILLFPPVIILAGLGFSRFSKWAYEKFNAKIALALVSITLFIIAAETYTVYFLLWSKKPAVASAFSSEYTDLAHQLRDRKDSEPIYLTLDGGGIDVLAANPFDGAERKLGAPLSSQVIMYITQTFDPTSQKDKKIFYIRPSEMESLPRGSEAYILR